MCFSLASLILCHGIWRLLDIEQNEALAGFIFLLTLQSWVSCLESWSNLGCSLSYHLYVVLLPGGYWEMKDCSVERAAKYVPLKSSCASW